MNLLAFFSRTLKMLLGVGFRFVLLLDTQTHLSYATKAEN